MQAEAALDYHVERARAELDAAWRAAKSGSAWAHLRLCSLHVESARRIQAEASIPLPELEWIEICRPLHQRCLAVAG